MSLQDIKFQSESQFGYKAMASRAAELENHGLWSEACEMWTTARKVAKKPENMLWAQVRADYCLTAKHRNWRAAA
ncbi:ANR family transcriptional regulator [Aeromonas veronii]|uniref:ANR family transcriptional regulator n=1 Tax=Aeromonas veronii TaxID=654 RepID=UPI003D20A426